MNWILDWRTVFLGYIGFLVLLLVLAGCSTTHVVRIGDTTYSAGFQLHKSESE
jgi:hypothetical protein